LGGRPLFLGAAAGDSDDAITELALRSSCCCCDRADDAVGKDGDGTGNTAEIVFVRVRVLRKVEDDGVDTGADDNSASPMTSAAGGSTVFKVGDMAEERDVDLARCRLRLTVDFVAAVSSENEDDAVGFKSVRGSHRASACNSGWVADSSLDGKVRGEGWKKGDADDVGEEEEAGTKNFAPVVLARRLRGGGSEVVLKSIEDDSKDEDFDVERVGDAKMPTTDDDVGCFADGVVGFAFEFPGIVTGTVVVDGMQRYDDEDVLMYGVKEEDEMLEAGEGDDGLDWVKLSDCEGDADKKIAFVIDFGVPPSEGTRLNASDEDADDDDDTTYPAPTAALGIAPEALISPGPATLMKPLRLPFGGTIKIFSNLYGPLFSMPILPTCHCKKDSSLSPIFQTGSLWLGHIFVTL
jgi:hypothetical protein